MNHLSGKTTIVVGASRGLGHGIATAFAAADAPVIAVSRTKTTYPETAHGAGTIQHEAADAGDATVPASLLDRYEPQTLILVAGASPHMRPLQHHTWETFPVNWQTDVRITFHWLRETLLKPLQPGSTVVVIGSGAALNGHRSAVDTPAPKPLSTSSPGTPRTRRNAPAWTSPSPRYCPNDPEESITLGGHS